MNSLLQHPYEHTEKKRKRKRKKKQYLSHVQQLSYPTAECNFVAISSLEQKVDSRSANA